MTSTMQNTAQVRRIFMGLAAFALAATAIPAKAGPFGFEKGMTTKQVQALVKLEPAPIPGSFVAKTAPKPHWAFEVYMLIFSPKTGLAKVGAIGKEVTVAETGFALRRVFDDMEKSLSAKYGKSTVKDELALGSLYSGQGHWMEALRREERVLEARWDGGEGQLPDGIRTIVLKAAAESSRSGRLAIQYEFSNYQEFWDTLNQSL